jgi:hypothetical protein
MPPTELTSGTPIDPAGPCSGVVEALHYRGAGVDGIAAGLYVGGHGGVGIVVVVVIVGVITTTTITATG